MATGSRPQPPSPSERKVNELRKRKYDAMHRGGDPDDKQHPKGKLTARERVELLCDPGSFRELDALAVHRTEAFGMADRKTPGDGVVTGYGLVEGREIFLFAHDASVFGGSLGEVFAEKVCKVMDLAVRAGRPCIGINDSGGARIQEGVVSLAGYADIFYRNVQSSGVVPQISVIVGPCTGGAVYSPAITDFIFMVEQLGYMFITGPEVIRVTTGEKVGFDDLGGAGVHNIKSGVAHFLSHGETEVFASVRQLLAYLPANNRERPPAIRSLDDPERRDLELQSLVPDNPQQPYDMKAAIGAVVDRDSFLEVQEHFAQNLVVGLARLDGEVVGIVGNQPRILAGALDINASVKGARFVRFCDAFNIPLITFVDVPGFLPGTAQEYNGIIRHGAKLLYAFAEATVPKLTVITRKAYGGAYDVMSSKHIGADFNFAWPSGEIAVMGPQAAVNIIFKREIAAADDPARKAEELVLDYKERFANPYVAAERGYVDDVIEPQDTRPTLISSLRLLKDKQVERPHRRHGNIPL
ncbi:MAG: acyl-CoA carboxylase subunit beta [Candidatus Dormibacteraeota bacterium]|nr:acyl-CoA carboxylase subunit beta [Candidatus Dormibacteraeota bacterium]